jgi:apolipoprotein N-acyltransferase
VLLGGTTPYVRFGDWPLWAAGAVLAAAALGAVRRRTAP